MQMLAACEGSQPGSLPGPPSAAALDRTGAGAHAGVVLGILCFELQEV